MRNKTFFECGECQYQSPKFYGKCPQCESWSSMMEISGQSAQNGPEMEDPLREPVRLSQIDPGTLSRIRSEIDEFDRSLGGGIVPGSVILIGGEPGVGKSTLLLQVSSSLSGKGTVLYYSGEESEGQIKSRADRLRIDSGDIYLLTMGDLEDIKSSIKELSPEFLIIDSVQTLNSRKTGGFTGSVPKLRQVTSELVDIAKKNNITVFIIGHITKDGQIAGPKTL